MGTYERKIIDIPLHDLDRLDDTFFRQIEMSREKVMKKMADQLNSTRQTVFSTIAPKGLFASYKITAKSENQITLENGHVLKSEMLAKLFASCDEVLIFVVTAKGYEVIDSMQKEMLEEFFFDGWGSAAASEGQAWLRHKIENELNDRGLSVTKAWSPGQHNVDIKMQTDIFTLLEPEDIGVSLGSRYMMHPQKSTSGFMGIGADEQAAKIQPCDFCSSRETCPHAYQK